MWIEHHVDPARVFVFTQNFRPRFAAVGGPKDSALLIWTERVSESSHQNHVGISWIDNQRADLATVFESDIFPGFAGVDGFVNADSISGVAANCCFTSSNVDDIMIRRSDRNRADRGNIFFVEKGRPILAAIGRFPNSARNCAEIIGVRFAGNAFNREGATAAERSDLSPLHSTKKFFVDRAWRNWLWRRHWRFRGRRCLAAFFRRRSNRKDVETNGKQRRREQKTQSMS